ncbi:MAG: hypothetical protein KC983_04140 [Phycisphaerales bacterium]|nr:hypothetical protein [Phycisphaerales bacterium]
MTGVVWSVVCASLLGLSSSTLGPEWVEDDSGGDAGSVPAVAQPTIAAGPVVRIRGSLQGISGLPTLTGGPDLEDMYIIQIVDPGTFSATTVPEFGGSAEFDTRLYLFDENGNPLLGSDDTLIDTVAGTTTSSGSTLMNMATDDTNVVVLDPGIYFIAITVSPRVPRDGNGQPLFMFDSPTEVSGPDGPGGGNPIEEWVPEPTGACCFGAPGSEEGLVGVSCEVLTDIQCFAQGGDYLGDDSTCEFDCFPPTGACCIDVDTCQEVYEFQCIDDLGGIYAGDGSTCAEDCDGFFGACCLSQTFIGFDCVEMTADQCSNAFGIYLGDGTTCDDVSCPEPIGACCVAGKISYCYVTTEDDCVNGDQNGGTGVFGGNGTTCDQVCNGLDIAGACCFIGKEGYTCAIYPESTCDGFGGTYQGEGTTCLTTGCPTGACCFGLSGLVGGLPCSENVNGPDCMLQGGVYQGDGTSCLTVTCPFGACCFLSSGGDCTVTTEADCLSNFGGTYLGDGVDCSQCYGACCITPALTLGGGPICTTAIEEECTDLFGGVFQGGGTDCNSGICDTPPPPPPGDQFTASAGPSTGGNYVILLSGVIASGPDCDGNQTVDILDTEPEYDPTMSVINDECVDAEFIGPGVVYNSSTVGLTVSNDIGPISCGVRFGYVDGWFKYRPRWTDTAFVGISGPPTEFVFEIHDHCPEFGDAPIACNSPNPFGVSFHVERGETYWIRIAARDYDTAAFTLNLSGPPALLNPGDMDQNGLPDSCDCLADTNEDSMVNVLDYIFILNHWGLCPMIGDCPQDIDGNGSADVEDLRILLNTGYGPCDAPELLTAPQNSGPADIVASPYRNGRPK